MRGLSPHLSERFTSRVAWRGTPYPVVMTQEPSLRDLGIIGDRRTAAIVTRAGSVVWYCPGQFDAPSLLAGLVDPARGGAGVGRRLARDALLGALDRNLSKIVVEVVADALPAIAMFEGLGFEPEALLRDHVRDGQGRLRDLIVLAHSVDETWSGMAAAGLDDALS